jgi:hypothetical protein
MKEEMTFESAKDDVSKNWLVSTRIGARHVRANHNTPRITLAKMMASPSDSVRSLAGIFMTHLHVS